MTSIRVRGFREQTVKEEHKSFQEDNRKLFIGVACFGYYVPGLERIFPSTLMRNIIRVIFWITISCGMIVFLLFVFHDLVFTSPPVESILHSLRRSLPFAHGAIKLCLYVWLGAEAHLAKVLDVWNDIFCRQLYADRLQALFTKETYRTRWYFVYSIVLGTGIMQAPQIFAMFKRYASGAEYTIFYHDPGVWYHYYLLGVQYYGLLMGTVMLSSFNIMILFTCNMGSVQLSMLKESLADIFPQMKFENEEIYVKKINKKTGYGKFVRWDEVRYEEEERVRQELSQWVKLHQITNEWFVDMLGLLKLTSTLKYLYVGCYVILFVVNIVILLNKNEKPDILLYTSIIYFTSTMPPIFYESSLINTIYDKSLVLTEDVLTGSWMLFPNDVKKSLLIIDSRSIFRPTKVMVFNVFPDNLEHFLSILQTAYSLLSVLLQSIKYD